MSPRFIRLSKALQTIFQLTLTIAFAAIASIPAFAESDRSALVGRVLDPSGAAVAGATVTLKSLAGGQTRTVTSDADGRFSFPDVPDAAYRLTATGANFAPATFEVALSGSAPREIVLMLQPGNFSEVVTVRARDAIVGVKDEFNGAARLDDVQGAAIYAGKKNEVVLLDDLNANTALNTARQVFAKVPGINIWENDGSGIQIGIAARGLNPNRSWEFNTRQNGYDISSDILGYPEAYFNPPLEAVQRIDIVRGAASLQYGTQFGGLVNYITREAPRDRKFSFETQQTGGSNGLFNSYNQVGGTLGKFSYSGYVHHRRADGWRRNSRYDATTGFASLGYKISDRLNVLVDLTTMEYTMQQPGGLTDRQFREDARQSFRARNWFQIKWFMPAVRLNWEAAPNTRVNLSFFALRGERNSVGNVNPVVDVQGRLVADVPNSPRTVDIDQYRNFGTELRVLHSYSMFGQKHTLATGFRYFDGRTLRQRAPGTSAGNADFRFAGPLSRNLNFNSFNTAFFVENIFRLTRKLSVTPGFRYERITTEGSGEPIVGSRSLTRNVPLFGIGVAYQATEATNFYANFSQAFRATHFNDVWRVDPLVVVNPDLKDVRGYNVDFGYRGMVGGFLNFDVGGFVLAYNDRIGQIATRNAAGQPIQLVTNVADSRNVGAETFVEVDILRAIQRDNARASLSVFSSATYTDAKYIDGPTRNNRVELAPEWISRFGVTYGQGGFSATLQYNRVTEQFTNASNQRSSVDGTQGIVPTYQVLDLSGTYRFRRYTIRAGINNLADERYFTRRATGYPGPGLIPADGRTAYGSFGLRF